MPGVSVEPLTPTPLPSGERGGGGRGTWLGESGAMLANKKCVSGESFGAAGRIRSISSGAMGVGVALRRGGRRWASERLLSKPVS